MAHHEHEHNHGHDHGHHAHGDGHHEEKKGFWFTVVNDDGAGGFAVLWTIIALCCILWLVTH
jgi:hypothetical protein